MKLLGRGTPIEEAKRWLSFLGKIQDELLHNDTLNKLNSFKLGQLSKSLLEVLPNLATIPNVQGFINVEDLHRVLPPEVQVCQYGSCI